MNEIVTYVVVVIFVILVALYLAEQSARKKTEEELQRTRESLKKLCEVTIKENNSIHAKITYEAYFGKNVEHTGDGFVDGE